MQPRDFYTTRVYPSIMYTYIHTCRYVDAARRERAKDTHTQSQQRSGNSAILKNIYLVTAADSYLYKSIRGGRSRRLCPLYIKERYLPAATRD